MKHYHHHALTTPTTSCLLSNTASSTTMSMYKFVKGARLFMQGKREENDYDNVADTFSGAVEEDEDLRAVHTYRATEMEGTTTGERYSKSVKRGNIRHRTTRTVRKVTTITRGEQSVTSESVLNYSNENKHSYPAINNNKKNLKFRVVEQVTLHLTLISWPDIADRISMKFTYPKLGVLTLTKVNNNHFISFSQNSHINTNCISVSVS